MSRIVLTFACGCVLAVDEAAPRDTPEPECPTHHETRIARVKSPAPRFRGHVTGPVAETDRTLKPV